MNKSIMRIEAPEILKNVATLSAVIQIEEDRLQKAMASAFCKPEPRLLLPDKPIPPQKPSEPEWRTKEGPVKALERENVKRFKESRRKYHILALLGGALVGVVITAWVLTTNKAIGENVEYSILALPFLCELIMQVLDSRAWDRSDNRDQCLDLINAMNEERHKNWTEYRNILLPEYERQMAEYDSKILPEYYREIDRIKANYALRCREYEQDRNEWKLHKKQLINWLSSDIADNKKMLEELIKESASTSVSNADRWIMEWLCSEVCSQKKVSALDQLSEVYY